MNNFKALLKLFIKDRFAGKNGKGKSYLFALGAAYLVIIAAFVSTVVIMAKTLGGEFAPELMTLIMIADCLLVFTFGVFSVIGTLYLSKDAEFLLGLPVKSWVIYAAKIVYIFLSEAVVSAAMLIPSLTALGITLGLGPLFYVGILIALVLTPALPVFLAAVIAAPLMYVVSFFRNKGAFTSIAALLTFGIFFALYYVFITKIQGSAGGGTVQLTGGLISVCKVFYPLYAVAKFSLAVGYAGFSVGASLALNFVIFFFGLLALASLSVFISNFVYRRSVSKQLESGRSGKNSEGSFNSSGSVKALIKREWKDILRNSTYAIQCLGGVIFCPIIVAFICFTSIGIDGEAAPLMIDLMQWMTVAMMLLLVGSSVNVGASTCFSRDGQNYYYVKMLPVSIFAQLKAKRVLYTLISGAAVTLSIIVASIGMAVKGAADFAWWMPPLLWLLSMTESFAVVNLAVYMDFSRPNLNWKTYREIAKNSRNAAIPMLIGMAAALVQTVVAFGMLMLFGSDYILGSVLALLVPTLIAAVLAFVFYNHLNRHALIFQKRLGE